MTLVRTYFYASTLRMQRQMNVLLPERHSDAPIPVLYLLHGWGCNHSDWLRSTKIQQYADAKGLAVVMPSSDLSFYADMRYGYDFYRFFSQELPALVSEFFPALSTRREDTFIGGQSMGGLGALKLGTLQPDRYAAIISLSGPTDLRSLYKDSGEAIAPEIAWAYGATWEDAQGGPDDLFHQLETQLAAQTPLPRYYLSCGQEDPSYQDNQAFRKGFASRLDLTWHEEPGGHTWDYWDHNIQRAIQWLPLKEVE